MLYYLYYLEPVILGGIYMDLNQFSAVQVRIARCTDKSEEVINLYEGESDTTSMN